MNALIEQRGAGYLIIDIKHSPDFCIGWAYVMTPRQGLRLAEVAANIDPAKICLRLEDLFITGMLRERIEGKGWDQDCKILHPSHRGHFMRPRPPFFTILFAFYKAKISL